MVNRTITARDLTLNGRMGGAIYVNGSVVVDDATLVGKQAIEFAKRQGWAVNGGVAAAVDLTAAEGEAIERWTTAELEAYLDAQKVTYPDDATDAEMRAAVRDAFETKAQGGSAANESAGHESGTIPPEGAPPVSNLDKPDDATEAAKWHTPLSVINEDANDPPVITAQPEADAVVEGATATVTVVATGPDLSYQWARQTRGAGAYVAIEDAIEAEYTTPALTVAENHLDRYRVVITNTNGTATSTGAQITVTAP